MRSAACLRVIRFRQSGQYLTLFELEANAAPQTVHTAACPRLEQFGIEQLIKGSTAIRNHLQRSE